jgi:alpha-galactosidase/6-phospho-beta-glucosidase family protein
MREILDDVAVACPGARILNYTNPVNVVAQAVAGAPRIPPSSASHAGSCA